MSDDRTLFALLDRLDRGGKDFERLAKWFLETDPEYASLYARVWAWDDWPGRWDIDRGIDLVAELRDGGGLVAIQAKNYDERYSITKSDVDTFLSESNRPDFVERLLIATTDRVAASGLRTMDQQEKPVRRCLLSRLAEAAVAWPASMAGLATPRPDPLEPRPHQSRALEQIERGLKRDDRGQVIMACGTGKSLVALWASERLHSELTLVLVPTLQLLRQTAQTWAAQASGGFAALKVCSEKDKSSEESRLDVGDMGSGTTTDHVVIAQFLRGAGRRVVFSTYASSPQIESAMRSASGVRFDLAICDEAHHCAGLNTGKFKTILDEEKIRAAKRLFFTATPEVYRSQDVQHMARQNVPIASMRDRRLFGRVLFRLSLADAISEGLLCPYQVVFMPVTDDEVHDLIRRREIVTPDEGDTRIDAYSLATQIACARAMRIYGCRRMVSFHPRIADSQTFASQFNAAKDLLPPDSRPAGTVLAEHVDGGKMTPALRRRILRQFEDSDGDHRLLSNVKLVAEGYDAPCIDAIAVVATERNPSQIVQMIGRAVRKHEGKTVGTIVLPVLVHGDEPLSKAMTRSEHKCILKLLAALRSADPDLERSLTDLRVEVGPDGRAAPAKRRFILNVAREVDAEFARHVDVMLVEQLAPSRARESRPSAETAARTAEFRKESGRSHIGPVVFDLENVERVSPAMVARGIASLERYAERRLGIAPDEHTVHNGFPLGRWWTRILDDWGHPAIAGADRQRIANLITWLTVSRETHQRVRRDLSLLTTYSVVDHVHALVESRAAPWGIDDLARSNVIGPRADLDSERIRRALTFPGMPAERQAEILLDVLHRAGWEVYRRPLETSAFVNGFLDGLDEYPNPHRLHAVPAPHHSEFSAGHYVAGWEYAREFEDAILVSRDASAGTVPDRSRASSGDGNLVSRSRDSRSVA